MTQADIAYAVYKAIDEAIDNGEFTHHENVEDLLEPTIDNGYVTTLRVDGKMFRIRVNG